MTLGVAYYPEHWPEERWETDARLMREAGIRRARVAEFAWHRLEPREGELSFAWLDRAVAVLGRAGIGVIMCTPTPTYPAWLHRKYPDIHQVKSNGQVKEFGQRQDACKSHPGYRLHARRITAEVARHFGPNPDVVAWQTDNELGCHGTVRCCCAYCEKEFQTWLHARYQGDVERLNRAWGTVFWSQEYNDFSEVSPPRDTADQTANNGQNPGLLLDYYRFSSDVQVRFQREQVELIRRSSPGRPVTHNLMPSFYPIDYFDLSRDLDVVSWDNYPFSATATDRPPAPLPFALMRGLKRRNVWVMEQASGPGGWGAFAATPRPGQMRLWAYQAVARGADMVSFFRWRTCRFGREQYWHGILHHHGQPQARYEEVRRLGGELERLSPELDGTEPEADVALLFDFTSFWALEAAPQALPEPPAPTGTDEPHACYGYAELAGQWLRVLDSVGVGVAVVPTDADLSGYRAVLAPTLHVVTPELAAGLARYVETGGTLFLGPRSGVKDANATVVEELLPGLLRALAGVTVEDYDVFSALGPGRSVALRGADGTDGRGYSLAEALIPEGQARTVMSYGEDYYAGKAAVVENQTGAGRCVYVGTVLGDRGMARLFASLLPGCGGRAPLPPGLEVVRRVAPGTGGRRYAFYLNHSATELRVRAESPGQDLLCGQRVAGDILLPAYGVAVVAE